MAKKRDVIAEELNALADDLERLWRAATQDPKKEARRRRTWLIVSGILSAASTMAGRRVAAKVWPILTGETPPVPNAPPEPAPSEPRDRSEQPTAV